MRITFSFYRSTFVSSHLPTVSRAISQRRRISSLYVGQGKKASLGPVEAAYEPDSQWSVEARSLLRAILRECTYLPDPQARHHVSRYAIGRFREISFKAWKHRLLPDRERFLRLKLREARDAIKQLRRANEGEAASLLKVLSHTYGRLGKRRHELMKPLLPTQTWEEITAQLVTDLKAKKHLDQPEATCIPPTGGMDVDSHDERVDKRRRKGDTTKQMNRYISHTILTPALSALVKSQIGSQAPMFSGNTGMKTDVPEIAEYNTWGKPMPASRIKNQARKWYGETLKRVLPPLPVAEWCQLRDLATGVKCPSVVIPRRTSSTSLQPSMLEIVVSGVMISNRTFGNQMAGNITPHSMRNLWKKVFATCPLMEWDDSADDGHWHITWGYEALYSWNARTLGGDEQRDQASLAGIKTAAI